MGLLSVARRKGREMIKFTLCSSVSTTRLLYHCSPSCRLLSWAVQIQFILNLTNLSQSVNLLKFIVHSNSFKYLLLLLASTLCAYCFTLFWIGWITRYSQWMGLEKLKLASEKKKKGKEESKKEWASKNNRRSHSSWCRLVRLALVFVCVCLTFCLFVVGWLSGPFSRGVFPFASPLLCYCLDLYLSCSGLLALEAKGEWMDHYLPENWFVRVSSKSSSLIWLSYFFPESCPFSTTLSNVILGVGHWILFRCAQRERESLLLFTVFSQALLLGPLDVVFYCCLLNTFLHFEALGNIFFKFHFFTDKNV